MNEEKREQREVDERLRRMLEAAADDLTEEDRREREQLLSAFEPDSDEPPLHRG